MNNTLQTVKTNQHDPSKSSFSVGIALSVEEKHRIFQFRYQVYVEEMSRQLKSVENGDHLLYDEMDDWGYLLYVTDGSELVGISRINIGRLEDFTPELVDSLALTRFQKFYQDKEYQQFALITKLMVSPAYRNSQVLYLLMAKAYELSCSHKVQFTYGGCNSYLLPLYEQMGGRRFGGNFQDPGYGMLTPIVWLIDDVEHMRKVRSPFYRQARKRSELNEQVTDWFFTEFPEARRFINTQLVAEDELWTALYSCLGTPPDKALPVLLGVSETEAKKFLHKCGIVARCYAGDRIATAGDPSNELNILLKGELQSTARRLGTDKILPGQNFGASGLVQAVKQTHTTVAVTDAEILVLSRLSFAKFCHHCPDTANQIINNISRISRQGGVTGEKQA